MGELALVREPGAGGDLRQGQDRPSLQQLPGPLDPAQDDVLVRRQPGRRLELPLNESLNPPQRHRDGMPAGTTVTEPPGGGRYRFTSSYRKSISSGGRLKMTSV